MSEQEPKPPEPAPEPPRHRLDPDRAAGGAPRRPAAPRTKPGRLGPTPVIDVRPYRWMIAIFGLGLFVTISLLQFANHGVGTPGIPAGKMLRSFAAPLAASTLTGDANVRPPCTAAKHDPRALNTCLLVHRAPLVLGFFVTGSGTCERQVDALQAVSQQFPTVQFAAVAIRASHASAAKAVRSHHWTIPVAYDRDGAVGDVYGIGICPIVELAHRGGIVADRLIGGHWTSSAALAARVRTLVSG